MMRVAVVGGGLSGLVAAHELARSGGARVTVYEKEDHLGGAKTVAVNGGSGPVLVDLDFMVFNRVTFSNMMEWFERLGVEMEKSDMSFSASLRLNEGKGFEWGTRNGISSVLVQKSNLLSPRFWLMINEIFKFKNHALKYQEDYARNPDKNETFGQFIQSHRYSQLFQDAYLIPMCACIWSCPPQNIFGFPAGFVLSFFCDNHLLELFSPLQWLNVKGGSGCYVKKVREELESMGCQIKTGCEVRSVSRFNGGYRILEADGSEEMYDRIIFCVHAPDALKILGEEATPHERRVLGAFQYIYSDLYFHCDESFMPRNSSAWSAMNFLGTTSSGVCVTYWLNILQNIESAGPFLATLNPPRVPDHVLLKWHTRHPIPSMAAARATLELNSIQGKRGIWFCVPYQQGYGNHEDSVKAGKAVTLGLLGKKCDLLVNPKPMIVPSWTEAGVRYMVAKNLGKFITIGNFSMLEDGGTSLSFGKTCERCQLKCVIRVHNPQFYWKIATEGDPGFAYSYINGYISFVDKKEGIQNIVEIIIANRGERKRLSSTRARNKSGYVKKGWWTPLFKKNGAAMAKYVLHEVLRRNTISKARKNISAHYDLSNDFFALFLDPTMTYSCGIFKAEDESLEAAQLRKLDNLINKAKVDPGHHVLDIGCGWGSLAIRLVKRTGCKCTGITLSEEQLKYGKRKVKEFGLEDHITLLLCDYRQIPNGQKFDRIISCGMLEHVGHEFYEDFFASCEYHLAEHGLLVLQSIAVPEELYDKMRTKPDFLKEYIFPGGCIPSLARIASAMSNASRLCIQHVENIGYHYYPTLIHWRENFEANEEKVLALGFDEKFIRTWEYYLNYCAAMFKSHMGLDYQIVFARAGDAKLPSYVAIA
ncbi:uncharacterized protein [Zea mays]|uniref:Cyclopropane-fatty-acyl-phospholipid synthase n=1 Tax=Zea mays TaxID=4577 RepID=A0A1D6KPI4_MAIZE|nr:uncharacterized protein LOC103643302 isoform X2 [Zea mays]ONM04716.1 Cyclopropane-fatty-acyl-phospholipid synthase [Zea mays]ONM04717.1 Cyclopropane-fatty-acyl-phospholipid synthase [Zea mays]|eukprot:XP_008664677.1 uncharacterized protein LOC103643302 isoform X2 [Zea mays]